ncbi:hypothetical protein [Pantoea sp. B65]|uniref:hypothetical protein n=1 Tax=Pantoea sp. B65 TaxID=2813359 RepID=UPI0039B6BD6E
MAKLPAISSASGERPARPPGPSTSSLLSGQLLSVTHSRATPASSTARCFPPRASATLSPPQGSSDGGREWIRQNLSQVSALSIEDKIAALVKIPGRPAGLNAAAVSAALRQIPGIKVPGKTTIGNALRRANTRVTPEQVLWVQQNMPQDKSLAKKAIIQTLWQHPQRPEWLNARRLQAVLEQLWPDSAPTLSTVCNALKPAGKRGNRQLQLWLARHLPQLRAITPEDQLTELLLKPDRPAALNQTTLQLALQQQPGGGRYGKACIRAAFSRAKLSGDPQVYRWVSDNWQQYPNLSLVENVVELLKKTEGKPRKLNATLLQAALSQKLHPHAPGLTTVTSAFRLFSAPEAISPALLAWVRDNSAPWDRKISMVANTLQLLRKPARPALSPAILHAALEQLPVRKAPKLSTLSVAFAVFQAMGRLTAGLKAWVGANLAPANGNYGAEVRILQLLRRRDRPDELNAATLYAAVAELEGDNAPGWDAVMKAFFMHTQLIRREPEQSPAMRLRPPSPALADQLALSELLAMYHEDTERFPWQELGLQPPEPPDNV